jgi:hypothetical protein
MAILDYLYFCYDSTVKVRQVVVTKLSCHSSKDVIGITYVVVVCNVAIIIVSHYSPYLVYLLVPICLGEN